jgi:hypothetical protein
VPLLKTDKQAEAFLSQDLSNLDFSQFKSAHFEFLANRVGPAAAAKKTSGKKLIKAAGNSLNIGPFHLADNRIRPATCDN